MDPASAMTVRLFLKVLREVGNGSAGILPTETLSRMLSLLLQAAERVSDELDERLGSTGL